MRAGSLAAVAVLLAASGIGDAMACRVFQLPAQRMNHAFDAIVIATVTEAAAVPDSRAWKAIAERRAIVTGEQTETSFQISRSGEPTACDDGVPKPAAGDDWVIYLRNSDGRQSVAYSYPLTLARELDPRLKDVE